MEEPIENADLVPVIILAGGRSTRFGSPKADAKLASKTLLEHTFDRLSAQNVGPILVNAPKDLCAAKKIPQIEDELGPGIGPLAGVHAAMNWAKHNNDTLVVTVSVDTPFLPTNLVERLVTAGAPAFAVSRERKHPLIGLWRAADSEKLETFLGSNAKSAHAWLEHCDANPVVFDNTEGIDPFFNINTPSDLEIAARFLLGS